MPTVYKGDVYDALTGGWQSTAQVAAKVPRTARTARQHHTHVLQALNVLADRGMAERYRDGHGAYWRRVRWRSAGMS